MTWLDVSRDSPFGLANLPYGVFSRPGEPRRVGVRVGDWVLDLAAALDDPVFAAPTLNGFLAQGRQRWTQVRSQLTELLTADVLTADPGAVRATVLPLPEVTMHLPVAIGDYVDFYASEHHASNIGRIFRPGSDPLTPNWKHLPIGYHGRSGTVVVSGTPVIRPQGQRRSPDGGPPTFGPSAKLDIEAELGFIVGAGSELGHPVSASRFADHVFGVCLVNDWSARDIQSWEYVPLGPFLGKSFATSVSPWVVPLDALAHATVARPRQDPRPLPYLTEGDAGGLDIAMEVLLNGQVISQPPYSSMYWTPAQMLAHLTVNGASVRAGDLYASGTVSGPGEHQRGSLIELTWDGQQPITLADGTTRTYLADGDEVSIRASAPGPGDARIGLGEVVGRIVGPTAGSGLPERSR